MIKYMLTLENRGGKPLNFEASDVHFPELGNNHARGAGGSPGRRDLSEFSIQKAPDAASNPLLTLAQRTTRIDNITIKIEKSLGRTRSVSRYATVTDAIVTDIRRQHEAHSRQTYEFVRFDCSRGSIKFG